MARIEYLVVHHTATPTSWTVERLRKLHVEQNGWRDIGYHYVIRLNDEGFAETHIGRPHDGSTDLEPWEYGAHVRGSNSRSLGLAMVGNWSEDTPDPRIRVQLVGELIRLCIVHDLDSESIKGHNEMPDTSTECCGTLFDMEALRRDVAHQLKTVKAVITGMEIWTSKNSGAS